ncbi:cobalamin (vitamin B12) biosynthesis CbiM protein CbiM [Clostridium aceticum]|uniref:Cobalamin (Vitamin B12) biosynthesis CbiM protein CbiM n=1 Tax=Clostridium aceticum TaxID=84022 RepID=A0A0D8I8A4_9CLOT|nr:CbiM family transporter [Clostridium aceticum]AKL97238.1 cobalamin (vitamin B12) biosynthesis CbiM protein CbiM [Clostridium aceticum]KJF26267.1 cobalamin biosynthesis protein CbiM [Clostridium aceticum]
MHLSDGVLSLPAVTVTSIAAGGMLLHSMKGIKEEEIAKISLMTATFFTFSLISIPIGPSSVHPLLAGLLGIVLGRRSSIAIFVGLLLQALFFQHGGLTTLGMNTLLIALPAMVSFKIFSLYSKKISVYILGSFIGSFATVLSVLLLVVVLFFSNATYSEGFLSVINLLVLSHLPLLVIEGFLTAFAVGFIHRIRPNMLGTYIS